jgi:pSer/pThr/pTyr-binding forkhead associated (FHA) protein
VIVGSASVEAVLLLLKILFLVLLYLFIWRIVRTASRDLRAPQETFLLRPGEAAAAGLGRKEPAGGRLVVLKSPALENGFTRTFDSAPVTVGRTRQCDLTIAKDEFASGRHARFEPRRDGIWVEDVGSTNGTFVNGIRLTRPRRLTPGDVVRIGETDLRFEQ